MSFSDNLKRARQRVGMTQQQIAEGLGITKSTYCGYETGKRQPDILKLRRLAFLLCTTTDALLSVNCDALECTVTAREYEQFTLFRQLPPESQRMVRLVFDEEQRRRHASRAESAVSGASVTPDIRIWNRENRSLKWSCMGSIWNSGMAGSSS